MMDQERNSGFTLLEVIVALAVLAVSMGAMIKGSSETTAAFSDLRDKTVAHWVAQNVVADMQLSRKRMADGKTTGNEKMAGRTWFWSMEAENTFDPDMRKIRVNVSDNKTKLDVPLVSLTAFLVRPKSENKS